MFLNKEKIKLFLKKEKELLKLKETWFIAGLGVLFVIGWAIPTYFYLQFPLAFAFFFTIPGGFAIAYSPALAARFVSLHKKLYKGRYVYSYNQSTTKIPSIWKYAIRTAAYQFAIIYTIISYTGIDEKFYQPHSFVTIITIFSIPALFCANIIHVAIYLLRRANVMYEDKEDGSRINLGRELAGKFDWAISPFILISFAQSIITKSGNPYYVAGGILTVLLLTVIASAVSFFFLKNVHLDKLIIKLAKKLEKII